MLSAVAASSDLATQKSPSADATDEAAASAFADTLAAQKIDLDRAQAHTDAKAALASKHAKDAKAVAPKAASPKSGDQTASIQIDGEPAIAATAVAAKKDAAAAVVIAKAESAAALAASLLTAIGAGASGTAAAATADTNKTKTDDADIITVGAKGKAKALAAARRDGAADPKAKAEATTERDGAKAEKATPAAATAAPEAKAAIAAKSADAAPPPDSATSTTTDASPVPSATPTGSSVELRIPLAREASAQAGAAAPVVAMRVHTKDGVTKAIELRLDPQGLGPVSVKLETDSQGRLRAVVQADKSEAFELLKRDGSTLEAALREAGVNLGEDGVSFSLNDGGQAGADSGQRNAAYDGAASRRDAALGDALATQLLSAAPAWRDGVIDISV